jgi:hypothetical protein
MKNLHEAKVASVSDCIGAHLESPLPREKALAAAGKIIRNGECDSRQIAEGIARAAKAWKLTPAEVELI